MPWANEKPRRVGRGVVVAGKLLSFVTASGVTLARVRVTPARVNVSLKDGGFQPVNLRGFVTQGGNNFVERKAGNGLIERLAGG